MTFQLNCYKYNDDDDKVNEDDDKVNEEDDEDEDDLWRQSYPGLGCHGQTQSTELFLIWQFSPFKAGLTTRAGWHFSFLKKLS